MILDHKFLHYHIEPKHIIGKGHQGIVYLGHNEKTNERVAIKVLKRSIVLKNASLRKALENEIQIMKIVQSDHIVKLLDFYETTHFVYLVLELCEGGDLRKYLQKFAPLKEEKAKEILSHILAGFQALRLHKIIHRDLKPANILLGNGKFKLADFGFSKILEDPTHMLSSYVGTPMYMCPQILTQKAYTSKSDIWSLGLIYYECLFANYPWKVTSREHLLTSVLTMRELPFPQVPAVSWESKHFISQCLQVSERARWDWGTVFNHPLARSFQSNKPENVRSPPHSPLSKSSPTFGIDSPRQENSLFCQVKSGNYQRSKEDSPDFKDRSSVVSRELKQLCDLKIMMESDYDKIIDDTEITIGAQIRRFRTSQSREVVEYVKQQVNANGTSELRFDQTLRLLKTINHKATDQDAKRIFEFFNKNPKNDRICIWELLELIKDDEEIDERPGIEEGFSQPRSLEQGPGQILL